MSFNTFGPGEQQWSNGGFAGVTVSCEPDGNCDAVGAYFDGSGQPVPDAFVLAAGSWSVVDLPVPTGSEDLGFEGLSCPVISYCVAVANYLTRNGDEHGAVETLSGGSWSVSTVPDPFNNAFACSGVSACVNSGPGQAYVDVLSSAGWNTWSPSLPGFVSIGEQVTCVPGGICEVSGSADGPDGVEPLEASLSGTTWQVKKFPLPANAYSAPSNYDPYDPSAVACASDGSCAAVGQYVGPFVTSQGVLMTSPDGTWSAIEAPLPPGGAAASLFVGNAITCPSAATCIAAGDSTIPNEQVGEVATETDGSWSEVSPPLPADANTPDPKTILSALSCPDTSDCVVVGSYIDDYNDSTNGVVLTYASGQWSALEVKPPAGAATQPSVSLTSVTCDQVGSCIAAGSYVSSSGTTQGLLLIDTHGTWTQEEAPVPTGTSSGAAVSLGAAGCAPDGTCFVLGNAGTGTGSDANGNAIVETMSSGAWSASTLPLPTGAGTATPLVGSVTCLSTDACLAVGDYGDSTGATQGAIWEWSAGSWSAEEAPLPAAASSSPAVTLNGIACDPAGTCVAVGNYADTSGNTDGLILTSSAGQWSAATAQLPSFEPGNASVALDAVDCPVAGTCLIVGSYVDSQGQTEGLLITLTNGQQAAAMAPLPPDAGANPQAEFGAIGCLVSGFCMTSGKYVDALGEAGGTLLQNQQPPVVTEISPTAGPTKSGTSVTITGTDLTSVSTVDFGTKAATITSDTTSEIVVTAPAGRAGTVNVSVITVGGTATDTGAYTYVTAPKITMVSPTSGTIKGGTSVTITGTNLASASVVDCGSKAATIVSDSATQIVVTTPAEKAGTVKVSVTTIGGKATDASAYTYIKPASSSSRTGSPE